MAGVGARLTGKGDADTTRMDEITVTALPAPVDEAGPFEVGHQFTELSGHASIRTILRDAASVKSAGSRGVEFRNRGGEEVFGGGAGGGEGGFEGGEHGHEFVHLGDDPALFGEGREGDRESPQLTHVDRS